MNGKEVRQAREGICLNGILLAIVELLIDVCVRQCVEVGFGKSKINWIDLHIGFVEDLCRHRNIYFYIDINRIMNNR